MKVVCDRAALLDAVRVVSGVVNTRTPKPQLSCVKMSAKKNDDSGGAGVVTLVGTDGEIAVRLAIVQVDVQSEGDVLIPADKLSQIVSAEDGEATLTFEKDKDSCKITGTDAKFTVLGFDPADYPQVAEFPASNADIFSVTAGEMGRLIGRTIFSTARENSRYAINGVLLKREGKKLEMVATDGRRLALARGQADNAEGGDGGACIIPTKALSTVNKLIHDDTTPVRVAITGNQAMFEFQHEEPGAATLLASNLVEGNFPPYEDVIPRDHDKKAVFNVDTLARGVRRAALLTNEESRGVRLTFTGDDSGRLTLKSRAPEIGESEITVDVETYEGDDLEIGFNPAFISDALKVVPEDQVIMELKAGNKPGLMKCGSNFLYVVMPVNLS